MNCTYMLYFKFNTSKSSVKILRYFYNVMENSILLHNVINSIFFKDSFYERDIIMQII